MNMEPDVSLTQLMRSPIRTGIILMMRATCEKSQWMQNYCGFVSIVQHILFTVAHEQVVVLRPRTGDRQGDGPAAQRYVLAADKPINSWCEITTTEHELNTLSVWGDWSESLRTPRHFQFADDASRVTTDTSPTRLVERVVLLMNSLRESMAPLQVAHNGRPNKLQLLLRLAHASPLAHQELCTALATAGRQATACEVAVHLGSLHETDGKHGIEFSRALGRCNAAWCAWHGYFALQ
jgi:hypothetical protein